MGEELVTETKKQEDQGSTTGNLIGGVVASIMSLPEAMAYGVLVFSAFHPQYAAQGLLAGIIAVVTANVGSALVRGVPIMSSSPFSLVTLMLVAEIPHIVTYVHPEGTDNPNFEVVFAVVFLSLFLAGVIQIIFGKLQLGQLVKFVPQPVVVGLFNGTALLILMGQISPMLGLEKEAGWDETKWLTLLVGTLTFLTAWKGARLLPKIPSVISAITVGVVVYHTLLWLGYSAQLGPMIGEIPSGIPLPTALLPLPSVLPQLIPHIPAIVAFAAALAVTASLGTLIGCIAADEVLQKRMDANKELMGQGVGNICSAFFGGIMSSGSPSRTIANFQYGGRTRLSRISIGIFALLVIVLLGPAVEKMPVVVLAALLVALAVGLFDDSTWKNARQLLSQDRTAAGKAMANLGISLVVTILLLTIGILKAVGFGLLLSLLYFASRMGKRLVRRRRFGDKEHSRVQRNESEFLALEKHGSKIQMLELEGSLFFGTADQLSVLIEKLQNQGVKWLLIDFDRVAELDSTGAKILRQSIQRCSKSGVKVAFSAKLNSPSRLIMPSFGLIEKELGVSVFNTLNEALVWSEELLLEDLFGQERYHVKYKLSMVDAFSNLPSNELERMSQYFTQESFEDKQKIIKQGQVDATLYIILEGRVQINSDLGGEESLTLSTLCPGRIFGELTFMDGRPRSGCAIAQGTVTCLSFDRVSFSKLEKEAFDLVSPLLFGIGKEISYKLRIANRTLH
jgi:SulP family sulfate permease